MQEHVFLQHNKVILVTENGMARWEFDKSEDAKKLFECLIVSIDLEVVISKLIDKS